jgi:UDP-GlcNAc:undecaprenyl-phosphate GlcNAc-1-phosphate transferase
LEIIAHTINLILLVGTIIVSMVINWTLLNFTKNYGLRHVKKHEEVRWQSKKPSIGGISFIFVFLVFNSIASYLNEICNNEIIHPNLKLGILISCSLGFIIGLIDDAKNTNPLLKLIGQILCGCILVFFGITIHISPNVIWNSIMTVLWVVFLMNSINMLDNMDGNTALISIVILSGMYVLSGDLGYLNQKLIIVIGSLVGFLVFNWHPSKIYMGDSGSQYLGIVLAALSIVLIWNHRVDAGGYFQINQFFIPLLVFTVPIFDTTTVVFHRLMRRQSPFVGGRDHLSHHLVYLGLKDSYAVCALAFINLIFIAIAILMLNKFEQTSYMYIIISAIWILFFALVQYFYMKADKLKS